MRWIAVFPLVAIALAQGFPLENLYGPFRVKELLLPNVVVLETGHRFLLGGIELPHWARERLLENQLRQRKLPLGLKSRAAEARLCTQGFLSREIYLELEMLPETPLVYLYVPQLQSHELILERPAFVFQGHPFDSLNYIWVRSGCAWATGQGRWAALFAEAQKAAQEERIGLWRP
ncbi:hypothetical protein [Thermus albus]|uniref:hypothetical protein n=1 Tax=Thermus albus TaxID=2908146 RepID=UPI001FAAF34E|nr:hypothetical protein [Thermus albus]